MENSKINELNFNHPVKELIWTNIKDASYHFKTLVDTNYNIKLNGHDRFESRPKAYFTRTQIWQHHTGPGGLATDISITDYASVIYIIQLVFIRLVQPNNISHPVRNSSRIDNAQLVTDPTALEGGKYASTTMSLESCLVWVVLLL